MIILYPTGAGKGRVEGTCESLDSRVDHIRKVRTRVCIGLRPSQCFGVSG